MVDVAYRDDAEHIAHLQRRAVGAERMAEECRRMAGAEIRANQRLRDGLTALIIAVEHFQAGVADGGRSWLDGDGIGDRLDGLLAAAGSARQLISAPAGAAAEQRPS